MSPRSERVAEFRAGVAAVAPMLVGVVPFGLVAGASPVAKGLGGFAAVGFSTIVFAGTSQLAAIDVLGDGGSAWVAAIAAWVINLRLLLYSVSLAPFLSQESLRTRLGLAYLLTDQAYAVSIARWGAHDDAKKRVPYYLGGALLLWVSWQLSTIAGIFVGEIVPDDVPLDFAVPMVFLTLLIPVIKGRPAAVAAVVGGAAAVLAAEVGGGSLAILAGALSGIAAGAAAELRWGPPPDPTGREPDLAPPTPEADVQ